MRAACMHSSHTRTHTLESACRFAEQGGGSHCSQRSGMCSTARLLAQADQRFSYVQVAVVLGRAASLVCRIADKSQMVRGALASFVADDVRSENIERCDYWLLPCFGTTPLDSCMMMHTRDRRQDATCKGLRCLNRSRLKHPQLLGIASTSQPCGTSHSSVLCLAMSMGHWGRASRRHSYSSGIQGRVSGVGART